MNPSGLGEGPKVSRNYWSIKPKTQDTAARNWYASGTGNMQFIGPSGGIQH